ncbi:MAG: dienelactone hydrolase family protein [Candidatus Levybacteria bacterium]|nr:dienelactone hydrolase family protein [Candidatus Levybacteria bacterium]
MRILKRIAMITVVVIVGFVLLLAGSISVDVIMGSQRIKVVSNTTVPGQKGSPDVRAFVAYPEGEGPFPAVIMIHEFYGLNESIVGKAKGLAKKGYVVVAPDTFRGSTTSWIPRAIYQIITNKPKQVNQDLDAVFAWIVSQPKIAVDRVGILGFCYGGRTSLAYSLHNDNLAATVIFYGSPETDAEILKALPGPVLGIFGGADNSIPIESVNAFKAALNHAGIPNEITIYEGQPHAFVADIESIRSGSVQAQAWTQMLQFLEKNLKKREAAYKPDTAISYSPPLNWEYYLVLAYEHAFGTASHLH